MNVGTGDKGETVVVGSERVLSDTTLVSRFTV